MLPRFETCKVFDLFRVDLSALRDKKEKLDVEFDLARKAVNESGKLNDYILYTEQKQRAFTNLLRDIDASIACFNIRQSYHTDKTDEFQLGMELASSIMHCMITNMRALIQYRDAIKPTTIVVLAPLLMAGAALFAAPATPAIAIATFFASSKMLLSLGMTRSANYVGFPKSFALIASATDSLGEAMAELRPNTSLPLDVNLETCYQTLGIERPALPSQIEDRVETLMDELRKKLSIHLKAYDKSEQWQHESIDLADRMVGIMRAGNLTTVDALQHQAELQKTLKI